MVFISKHVSPASSVVMVACLHVYGNFLCREGLWSTAEREGQRPFSNFQAKSASLSTLPTVALREHYNNIAYNKTQLKKKKKLTVYKNGFCLLCDCVSQMITLICNRIVAECTSNPLFKQAQQLYMKGKYTCTLDYRS